MVHSLLGFDVVEFRDGQQEFASRPFVWQPRVIGQIDDLAANRQDGLNNPNNRRLHELLLTIAEQMGVTDLTDFADPAFVQGPLSEVLV